jgi:hypothetical protein
MTGAAWLRGLGADGLAALLRRRPEALAPPVPTSLAEMSERLAAPGSVVAALRRLNRPTLQVAEVIAALGGHAEPARLDRLLGATSPRSRAAVTGALNTLREHALLTADAILRLDDVIGTRNAHGRRRARAHLIRSGEVSRRPQSSMGPTCRPARAGLI